MYAQYECISSSRSFLRRIVYNPLRGQDVGWPDLSPSLSEMDRIIIHSALKLHGQAASFGAIGLSPWTSSALPVERPMQGIL